MDGLWERIPKSFQAMVKNNHLLKWITDVLMDYDRRLKEIESAVLHLRMESKARANPAPRKPAKKVEPIAPALSGPEEAPRMIPDMTAEDAWENM